MPLIFQHRIYREDLQSNPDVLYVFGDNEQRWGMGGQAGEMRGEPNAVGVATLKSPGNFWTDGDYARQCARLDIDMAPLFSALRAGRTVVFPRDGIGTGLARLAETSPMTFDYLRRQVAALGSISARASSRTAPSEV